MSCYSGPEPVSSGLVLSFDSANQKSFRGSPTTNINTTQNLGGMSGISLSFVSVENGWKKYSISGTWASGTYPFSMYISYTTLSGAVAYSAQSIIKTNVRSKFLTFSGLSYVNDVNMVNSGTSTITSLGPDTDGFDMILSKREGFIYSSGFANPTTSQLGYINSRPTADGVTFNSATDFVWVKNIQVEQGTTCTPWVESTRSNTQAILDLTRQNTLTANSLTYANNGTSYSFNGLSDYITANDVGTLSNMTCESMVKITSMPAGTQPCFITNVYPGTASRVNFALGFVANSSSLSFGIFDGAWYYSPTFTPSTNTWYHVCGSYNGSVLSLYVNGVLIGTPTSYAGPATTSNGGIRFGRRWDNAEYFNGNISTAKIYNRALTPLEIQQNFEATRSRYDV